MTLRDRIVCVSEHREARERAAVRLHRRAVRNDYAMARNVPGWRGERDAIAREWRMNVRRACLLDALMLALRDRYYGGAA